MDPHTDVTRLQRPTDRLGWFNWGAFALTWIWGLYHRAYLTLLYPLVQLVVLLTTNPAGIGPIHSYPINFYLHIATMLGMSIWFGFAGNEWAWNSRRFASVEHCLRVQRYWAVAGILFLAVVIPWIYLLGAD
jgi:hypothetical protein